MVAARKPLANSMVAAVAESVKELPETPRDAGAIRLANRYAAAIDATPSGEQWAVLADLGPKLLAVLESLGATPKGRTALAPKGGAASVGATSADGMDELRERRRRAREHAAQALDTPAS